MKNPLIIIILILSQSIISSAQDFAPAPDGKAVVYFVRPSALGLAVNFSYFDNTKLIGKFNAPKYIRYECEPGEHLFWARSENRDFIEANVDAGKIYFIEAVPKMGAMKAAVQLVPVDPADTKKMEKITKLLRKKPSESFTPEEIAAETKNLQDVIDKGLEKYREEKGKGKISQRLENTMYYSKL